MDSNDIPDSISAYDLTSEQVDAWMDARGLDRNDPDNLLALARHMVELHEVVGVI